MPPGLRPIVDKNANALVLGSFPGPLSLKLEQYYGYQRNLFWPIMARICDFDRDIPYDSRVRKLKENRIAVWDVLESCEREGAADRNILNPVANDFEKFLAKHERIKKIFFNGHAAERFFNHLVLPQDAVGIFYRYLPSTSPANANMMFEDKLAAWRTIVE